MDLDTRPKPCRIRGCESSARLGGTLCHEHFSRWLLHDRDVRENVATFTQWCVDTSQREFPLPMTQYHREG